MRILFLTSGPQVPSSRFRVLQFLPALLARGHECVVAASRPPKYRGWPWIGNRASQWPRRLFRLIDLMRARRGGFDLVFLEREVLDRVAHWRWEARFRAAAPAFLLDVDDGIHLAAPEKFAAIAGMASAVIAGNPALSEIASRYCEKVHTIPTVVDTARFSAPLQPLRPTPLVIGWTGLSTNLRQIGLAAPAIRELAREVPLELVIISDDLRPLRDVDLSDVPVRFRRWSEDDEAHQLRDLHIGIMPLEDSPWNRFKCGFKLLQYMSTGIPVVASPVGVNEQIVRPGGNGFLAATPRDWAEALRALASDPELRRRLGIAARASVEANYSLRARGPDWVAVVESLGGRQRS